MVSCVSIPTSTSLPVIQVCPSPPLNAGVFLHILADTLGSVGVIISSFLIGRFGKSHMHTPQGAVQQSKPLPSPLPHPPPPTPSTSPGWMLADPVCSMAITVLIVCSVYPLMKESLGTLMMRTPPTVEHYLPGAYQRVRANYFGVWTDGLPVRGVGLGLWGRGVCGGLNHV